MRKKRDITDGATTRRNTELAIVAVVCALFAVKNYAEGNFILAAIEFVSVAIMIALVEVSPPPVKRKKRRKRRK